MKIIPYLELLLLLLTSSHALCTHTKIMNSYIYILWLFSTTALYITARKSENTEFQIILLLQKIPPIIICRTAGGELEGVRSLHHALFR